MYLDMIHIEAILSRSAAMSTPSLGHFCYHFAQLRAPGDPAGYRDEQAQEDNTARPWLSGC
jgi:hypothetical protein